MIFNYVQSIFTIHIANNVQIGNNTIIAGQVGIAGSTIVGNNVKIGGQAGISGHLKIGNNVEIVVVLVLLKIFQIILKLWAIQKKILENF